MANSYITVASNSSNDVKEEFAQMYREHGLEGLVKEAGIAEANNLVDFTMVTPNTTQMTNAQTTQFIQPKQSFIQPKTGVRVIAAIPYQQSPAKQMNSPATSPMVMPRVIPAQVYHTTESPQWSSAKKRMMDVDLTDSAKRRRVDKTGKGLRHFSMKVCEKVQKKGVTSYNEVADELVADLGDPYNANHNDQYDQKNIRRRVYDALNVLMAMNIISKEKKEIRWKGLPTNSVQECQKLEKEREAQIERVKLKTQQLQELILQQIAFKNLVQRNKAKEHISSLPTDISTIQLPFIIVNTSKKTVIDCSISNDKSEYLFNFDNTFEIHDDIEVLKRMGMAFGLEKNCCSDQDLKKAVSMMPKALEPYILELAGKCSTMPPTMTDHSSASNSSVYSGQSTSSSTSTIGDNSARYKNLTQSPLAMPLPVATHPVSMMNNAATDHESLAAQHYLMQQSSIPSYSRQSPMIDEMYSGADSDSGRSSPLVVN